MDRINRWKLADELNVFQISLLIAGYDPSELEGVSYDRWSEEIKIEISAYLNSIKNAARAGRFKFHKVSDDYNQYEDIDWDKSLIEIESFTDWLRSRNFSHNFFFEDDIESDLIEDQSSEFYAPKLAAAVRAWKEITANPTTLNGKSPKRALEIWLREHAAKYGLTNKDGNPNELGIEEICKVANWKPGGGATRTPTPAVSLQPTREASQTGRKVLSKPPTPIKFRSIDDDIPF